MRKKTVLIFTKSTCYLVKVRNHKDLINFLNWFLTLKEKVEKVIFIDKKKNQKIFRQLKSLFKNVELQAKEMRDEVFI